MYFLPATSMDQLVPISRVTACRWAAEPTGTLSLRANPTIDGVVRDPSALASTVGPPRIRAVTRHGSVG